MQLTAGQLLQGGKYIINHPLETAGFGITYRGTQTETGQSVVLKTLHPALDKSRAFSRLRDRFVHLSCELTRCTHPSLVPVVELFQAGDWPFMAMEYIHGQSLAELVQAGRPLAEMEALHYVRTIGAGLQISHRQGLVHGNLKPENLLRRAGTNHAVIVGYGISAERMLAAVQYAVPGFPHNFTAPEQIGPTGDRVKSADLYGLAALLYYLLSGQAPIAASDRATLDIRQQLPQLNLIKPSLQSAIRQGLALNPADRPPSIDAWLQLLPDPNQRQPTAPPAPPRPAAVISAKPATTAPTPPPTVTPALVAATVIQPVQTQLEPPIAPPPTVIDRPKPRPPVDRGPTPNVQRPRYRPQPAPPDAAPPEPTPNRPRYRQQPIGQAAELKAEFRAELNAATAGISIAPPQASPAAHPRPSRPYASLPVTPRSRFNLKRWLIVGSSLAAIGGIGFGLVLRFSAHRSPTGSSVFDAEQAFPNRPWEGTLAPLSTEGAPVEDDLSAASPSAASPSAASPSAAPTPAPFDAAPMIERSPARPATEIAAPRRSRPR